MGIFSRQHACPQHRNLEFNELEELPDPRHSGCKGGRQVTVVVSILNHGLMTWMIWGTAILGFIISYIGDYHDPTSKSRENVARFEHCSSWGVNSNQIHGETTTFWVVVLACVTLVHVWFLHCVYSQIQTCYCTPW